MAVNPATKPEQQNSFVTRANKLNDPQFENQQGYYPFDLTHQEFCSTRFGEATPCCHLDTVPGDRIVIRENAKTILNQINGNFLSTVNQYIDTFYVPLRSVYPMNYEKLIPNPTKGSDLPNSALPQVPLCMYIYQYLNDDFHQIELSRGTSIYNGTLRDMRLLAYNYDVETATDEEQFAFSFYLSRIISHAYMLSRGQLLDYLGIQFDDNNHTVHNSLLQTSIDNLFLNLFLSCDNGDFASCYRVLCDNSTDDYNLILSNANPATTFYSSNLSKSQFRDFIQSALEAGALPYFALDTTEYTTTFGNLLNSIIDYIDTIDAIFVDYEQQEEDEQFLSDLDSSAEPFSNGGFVNIGKFLAYQQIIAQYYTNDSVDNIFNSDLFMQNLRAVMFPTSDDIDTREPIFRYNGVATEYDYISTGAFYMSLLSTRYSGAISRQHLILTLLFILRRTLRYGDYFSTGRPDMLAVGNLSIPISGGNVSPIDVTKNLLMQRYLNAANYKGSGFLAQFEAFYGVTPSDTGTFPRFVMHRKIELQNQVTNNTGDNQGAQTTNLVGVTDDLAGDVFIDDFGYIISICSYDVLPVYTSGIDNCYHLSDRFDFFNPMLQNIGDQPIRSSELLGLPSLYNSTFAYTMRNGEYKYKLSKAHGAFVNGLKGFMLQYPLDARASRTFNDLHINPDFIRDKPIYLDPVLPQMTGDSPATYFHFIVSFTNEVKTARKMQSTPPVLF